MASVNKVILVGHLGRDPEVRYSDAGSAVCNISLATTSQWTDKGSGERREETEWHRVVFYNRLAEVVGEYLKKGRQVYIEGRLKTRKWQDKKTGEDRYSTEVIADQMQMLGSRGNSSDDDGGSSQGAPAPSQAGQNGYAAAKGRSQSGRPARPAVPAAAPASNLADMDDDIPF